MDPMLAVKVAQVHTLTDVMIDALRTGTLSEAVRCAPRQLGALTGRGLVDSESHTLTLLGDLLVRTFIGAELTEEERREALTSIASGASTRGGGFVVDTTEITSGRDPRTAVLSAVRPAKDGEAGVPWTVAKGELEAFFTELRDFGRLSLKATKSLTKRDVMEAQQVEPFADEPQEETLFQSPVA